MTNGWQQYDRWIYDQQMAARWQAYYAGCNSWHAPGGSAGGWTARQPTDAWSTWGNTPYQAGSRGSVESARPKPTKSKRRFCRSKQVANFLRRCLKVMWDAAIEHRQQHNNFDVSAFVCL